MDLMRQCQKWHEENRHQKIVDAIEAVPEEERTPDMNMELARALNNLAVPELPEGRAMLKRSIRLLEAYEEEMGEDFSWNFRLGYAYYYLDMEGPAMRYLEKALELHPGDSPLVNSREETKELIDDCLDRLKLPRFRENFRKRTAKAWKEFAAREEELRNLVDSAPENPAGGESAEYPRGQELVDRLNAILGLAFDEPTFEVCAARGTYQVVFTGFGGTEELLQLDYFLRQAPAEVTEKWCFQIGREAMDEIALVFDGVRLEAEDVQVRVEKLENGQAGLTLYCGKLASMMGEDENRGYWALSSILDLVLGQMPAQRLVGYLDVEMEPLEDTGLHLSDLRDTLISLGYSLDADPKLLLESYSGYSQQPAETPGEEWRDDVVAGTTRGDRLLREYWDGREELMDRFHADGVAAGFFVYPLDGFEEPDRTQKIFDFRNALEEAIEEKAGADAWTTLGRATGTVCGYLDFMAWDLHAVLRAAQEFFRNSHLKWAVFQTFRRNIPSVTLMYRDDEDENEEPGSSRMLH